MTDAKERVRRQYGASGDAYVRSTDHVGGDDLRRLVELIEPRAHERALDIATGGGHTALAFAPHVAEVVASDLTPEMLTEAERFIAGRGVRNVTFRQADAEHLPFPDASFAIVTCRIAPHHFPDPARFVQETARVLQPGGRFGLIDSTVPDGELGARYNRFELARDPSHVRSLTEGEWMALLNEAGLELLAIERFRKRHDFTDWTDRARLPVERRDEVARILLDRGDEAIARFGLELDEGKLIAFTDVKTLFLGTPRR